MSVHPDPDTPFSAGDDFPTSEVDIAICPTNICTAVAATNEQRPSPGSAKNILHIRYGKVHGI